MTIWDKRHVLKIRDDRNVRFFDLTEENGEIQLVRPEKCGLRAA